MKNINKNRFAAPMAFVRLVPLLLVTLLANPASAVVTVDWIRQLGTSFDDDARSISADTLGNVYITGNTYGDLGGTNQGNLDAFISKYDDSGVLIWTEQLGTSSYDASYGVSADTLGNVYLTGYTRGDLGGINQGDNDVFISKYDASGSLLWTEQLGTSSDEKSFGVSADTLGNVYITGRTEGGLGGNNQGDWDAFVSKYDDSGSLLWTEQLGTSSNDLSYGVSADTLGNVYITGSTYGALGGTNQGGYDAFISKYDDSGVLLWTEQLGTSGSEESYGVSADTLGNVYITGRTDGDLGGTNQGGYDAYVSKYDDGGTLLWTQQLDSDDYDISYGVSADTLGNVYITGITYGALGGTVLGNGDVFVSKYDASGTLLWTEQFGSGGYEEGLGISADTLGNVYITGFTSSDPGGTNQGGQDIFVAKISDLPPTIFVDPDSLGAIDVVRLSGGSPTTVINPIPRQFHLGADDLVVGNTGTGQFLISGNGDVSNNGGIIGKEIGSTGTVTVDGAGSTWTNNDILAIGSAGNGTLNILNGGSVLGTASLIGWQADSVGIATVDGIGSTWTNTGILVVGVLGNGTLNIQNGGSVLSDSGNIGSSTDDGAVTVDGTGSTWTLGYLEIARGTLDIQNGGSVFSGGAAIGAASGNKAVVTVDGGGSNWNLSQTLFVGFSRKGTLNIQNGGSVSSADVSVGGGEDGAVMVDGVGSTWTNSNLLTIGSSGSDGTLDIQNGGSVSSTVALVGESVNATGTVTLSGIGSTWNNSDSLYVGGNVSSSGGVGALVVKHGSTLIVGGTLKIWDNGSVLIQGGTLIADDLDDTAGTFGFQFGQMEYLQDVTFDASSPLVDSGVLKLTTAKHAVVHGVATLVTPVILDGGELAAEEILGKEFIDFRRGTLASTTDMTVGSSSLHTGAIVTLATGQNLKAAGTLTIASEGQIVINGGAIEALSFVNTGELVLSSIVSTVNATTVTNQGVISGFGRIRGAFTNGVTGDVQVATGDRMVFTGPTAQNNGVLTFDEATLEFRGTLTNAANALIAGRGQLRVREGIVNEGAIAISTGLTDVFGDLTNALGSQVVISGNATVTFFDDVVHNGDVFRISEGASAVFFGSVSGSGVFTGTGTAYFEGDLRPGNSPGRMSFEGDLVLGAGSALVLEIAGDAEGEYDVLEVGGTAFLDGDLTIAFIDGYMPTLGQQFDLLHFGDTVGEFSNFRIAGNSAIELAWTPEGLLVTTAVPEPTSLLLAIIAAVGWTRGRRRTR